MVGNNNDNQQNSDQFNVERLIQETAAGNQSRPPHDGHPQPKNGQAVPVGQPKHNDGRPPSRDGQTATPSTQSSKQFEDLEADADSSRVEIPVPENVDPGHSRTAQRSQSDQHPAVRTEQKDYSYLGTETPPQVTSEEAHRHRSSSSSRSPHRRRRRNRSYSLSPEYRRDLSDSESPRGRKRNRGAASKKTSASKHKDLSPKKKPTSLHKGRGKLSRKLENLPGRDTPRKSSSPPLHSVTS
ncbi:pre-mRNA-splicing factor CWC22-like [Vicia villosa]|uniref:pre-mRNA-splicing factor CWC22-like n=1 Tax=Vicia villosa TaxID=3911 RepID=UPI00273CDC0D|nr:pre-mRNA-splicing factor CWC22-like [Vicia villosa]